MERKDFEIMAPVGSMDSLIAAIKAGADSVYFGIGQLNMRSKSANHFALEDLAHIAQLCISNNIKSYLTVNTVIYDGDIPKMESILDAAKKAGVSAIIASDIAVMSYCRQIGLEVHLSTQLNISNIRALEFYSQFADVVVLARELNLHQVKAIYEEIEAKNICGPSGSKVKIEMFCHGALCMAISGKCYLSLNTLGKSANRGECMQTCRRAYLVKDKARDVELEVDNQYIMSPKDLKTIGFLDQMALAGVRVFKIEGRARGPEYVRTVVESYNEALNCVIKGEWSEEKSTAWDKKLASVYNRGFWNGYYLGQTMGEWSERYGSQATSKKVYAGKVVKYFAKSRVAEFVIQSSEIKKGDKLLITGPTTGAVFLTLQEPWVNEKVVEIVEKGEHPTFPVPEKVRENDKLYILTSEVIQ